MKTGYYLFPTYVKRNEPLIFTGVMKKIDMQVKELSKWFDTEFKVIYAPSNWSWFQHKILNRLLVFSSQKREYEKTITEMADPDFIYIRKVEADRDYVRFLASLRRNFPRAKILVEIPTYPYEKEAYRKLRSKTGLLKDRIYRKKYKDYIDRFVVFSNDRIVFGVPAISTMNGIDVRSQKMIGEKSRKYKDSINLIFVGMMQPQHGLERIIKGLQAYYKGANTEDIRLLFVGDGPEYPYYSALAKKCGIERYIRFFGKKTGKELDDVYNNADIAICPLGCYKTLSAETRSSALKTREYLARGLPVVTGCIEDVFERNPSDFHLDFENDDSIIDVRRIVDWFKNLRRSYNSREILAKEIREYAFRYVDNASTMKPIIDYINSDER